MKNNILYFEKQRFKQWWVWLLLIGINGIFAWGFVQQIILKQPFGDKPMSNIGLIVMLASMLLFSILFLRSCLETCIRQEGIYVRYFPFHFSFKYYDWDSISKLYIRQYSPITE